MAGVDLLEVCLFSQHGKQPIGESSERTKRGGRGCRMIRMIDKPTNFLIRFVPPREKLRLCENQSRLMKPPASRPNLYYKQYEQKYWKWFLRAYWWHYRRLVLIFYDKLSADCIYCIWLRAKSDSGCYCFNRYVACEMKINTQILMCLEYVSKWLQANR